jgi:hypothetical protein
MTIEHEESHSCRSALSFIVGVRDRFVVTAAHCVPIEYIPPPDMSDGPEQLTFPNIIGPLGGTPNSERNLLGIDLRELFVLETLRDSPILEASKAWLAFGFPLFHYI